jgi:hypothetical protein
MVHSLFGAIITSFSLAITRNNDIFSSYPVRIETLSVAFLTLMLNPVRAVDRFFAVLSASVRSFF